MPFPDKRQLLINKGWIQSVVIVFLLGFMVLGMLAYRTYIKLIRRLRRMLLICHRGAPFCCRVLASARSPLREVLPTIV